MKRLSHTTQAAAQTVADRIHAAMITTDKDYAKSAADGLTKNWCVPFQEYSGGLGQPQVLVSNNWYVTVDERCKSVLTADEIASVPEWQV